MIKYNYFIFPGVKIKPVKRVVNKSDIEYEIKLNALADTILETLNEDVRKVEIVSNGGVKGVELRKAVKIYAHVAYNHIRDSNKIRVSHSKIANSYLKSRRSSDKGRGCVTKNIKDVNKMLEFDKELKRDYDLVLINFYERIKNK